MAAPIVPDMPTAPAPTDSKSIFNSRAFAWVAALTGWTDAVNALAVWMNAFTPEELDPLPDSTPQDGDLIVIYRDGIPFQISLADLQMSYPILNIDSSVAQVYPGNFGKYLRVTFSQDLYIPGLDSEYLGKLVHIKNATDSDMPLTEGTGVTIHPPAGGTTVIPPGGIISLIYVKSAALDYHFDLMGQVVPA